MNLFSKFINVLKEEGFISSIERFSNYIIRNSFLNNFLNKDIKNSKLINQLELLKIYKTDLTLERIGPKNDGGYILPNNLSNIDFCISPGVAASFEFERKLKKEWNIDSILIDGTLEKSLEEKIEKLNEFKFIKKNLSNKNTKNQISLDYLLKSLENKKLILQMDIEGFEYEILSNIKEKNLNRFDHIVIEFHDFFRIKKGIFNRKFFKIIRKLNKYFTLVHIHPNNCCEVFEINSIQVPNVFEVTFVNNSLVKYKKIEKIEIPHPEDSPNLAYKSEILLDEFFYNGKIH
tara:strand:- start:7 stop:876 length:870 start_codon:yes stop_codon:yes gene_type:complete